MKRILFLEEINIEKARVNALLQNIAGILAEHHYEWQPLYSEELENNSNDESVGIIVTVTAAVDRALLERFKNVRMVAVAFTGYDHVDVGLCKSKGISVYNVPDYATDSVAELTVGLALSILRTVCSADKAVRDDTFNNDGKKWRSEFVGTELAGKTVGVVGTGRIGLKVAGLFRAFGCELLGWSRNKGERFRQLGGRYVEWEDLFRKSDIVTLHVALIKGETERLVGAKEFKLMRPTACIINTARGAVIDEQALIEVLEAKKIGGAGLDVFEKEPLPRDNKIKALPNVVLTPHVAYKTREALQRRAEITAKNISRFFSGKSVNRVVPSPECKPNVSGFEGGADPMPLYQSHVDILKYYSSKVFHVRLLSVTVFLFIMGFLWLPDAKVVLFDSGSLVDWQKTVLAFVGGLFLWLLTGMENGYYLKYIIAVRAGRRLESGLGRRLFFSMHPAGAHVFVHRYHGVSVAALLFSAIFFLVKWRQGLNFDIPVSRDLLAVAMLFVIISSGFFLCWEMGSRIRALEKKLQ